MPSMTREDVNRVLAEFMELPQEHNIDSKTGVCWDSWPSFCTRHDWSRLLGPDGVWAKMSEEQRDRVYVLIRRQYGSYLSALALLAWLVEHGPEALARACAEAVSTDAETGGESEGPKSR